MRVLKTMNSIGEIKREDLIGLNINDLKQHHRRSARIIDEVDLELMLFSSEEKLIIFDKAEIIKRDVIRRTINFFHLIMKIIRLTSPIDAYI